jgi:hypothetical protein
MAGPSVHKGRYKSVTRDVRVDGPDPENEVRETQQAQMGVRVGWCTGDIDFDADGAVFIRNPYLANAIERLLRNNARTYDPNKPETFLFKLTRDEGFSGPKINIVC